LASGAYALGSQAGDGSATAKDNSGTTTSGTSNANGSGPRDVFLHMGPPPGGGPGGPGGAPGRGAIGFGLDRMADDLGVKRADLAKALRELRSEQPRVDPRDDFAKLLADELGVDQSKVSDALDAVQQKLRKAMEAHKAEFEQKLADKLGISVDKVKEAFPEPRTFERRHP
jgi:biotin operon repressor